MTNMDQLMNHKEFKEVKKKDLLTPITINLEKKMFQAITGDLQHFYSRLETSIEITKGILRVSLEDLLLFQSTFNYFSAPKTPNAII